MDQGAGSTRSLGHLLVLAPAVEALGELAVFLVLHGQQQLAGPVRLLVPQVLYVHLAADKHNTSAFCQRTSLHLIRATGEPAWLWIHIPFQLQDNQPGYKHT